MYVFKTNSSYINNKQNGTLDASMYTSFFREIVLFTICVSSSITNLKKEVIIFCMMQIEIRKIL